MLVLKRKLKNGKNAKEYNNPFALIIYTKCPEKWEIKDLETQQIYIGSSKNFIDYKKIFEEKIDKIQFGGWQKIE
jgi:hypothetical protein